MKLSRRLFLSLIATAAWSAAPAFGQTDAEIPQAPPWPILEPSENTAPLPGTQLLSLEGDLASQMVADTDAFLLQQIDASTDSRSRYWQRDISSPEAYERSVESNRQHLRAMLGMVDEIKAGRLVSDEPIDESAPTSDQAGNQVRYRKVRWPVLEGVTGVGIMLLPPPGTDVTADVICIQDADDRPHDIVNKVGIVGFDDSYPRRLAASGCRVLVPLLINREEHFYKMPKREWLHRPAYELGRSLAGYETQKILAAIDALADGGKNKRPLGVIGSAEGGRLALYAGALDRRIDAVCLANYFAPRQQVWNETADRTVFGLLREFGDAEVASLITPRSLSIQIAPAVAGTGTYFVFRPDENGQPENLEVRGKKNGKPGALSWPGAKQTRAEFERLLSLVDGIGKSNEPKLFDASPNPFSDSCLEHFASALNISALKRAPNGPLGEYIGGEYDALHAEQLAEIERHNQRVLQNSYQERIDYMAELKTDSLEAFNGSVEAYREKFRRDVVGAFDVERLPLNPRTRPYQEGPKTVSYEVVLDTFPGVFAYGVLTLPKDLKLDGSEKRPVVVCQHGLEGRPQDVISESKYKAYKAFATRLAERGFITFAPQNPYIFHDRFRTLQFKAAAVGCTLFSVIVPQHQQITDWLQTQAYVADDRIAFYGLSYGGKSAMRIPPLVSDYCLSICSADFNEWVWKNAATDKRSLRYSYANKGEYEIFEFGLGRTFNYAEMASLICPRPFMVERGHFDGVGPDDRVAQEFAKVRFLYQAKLGIGDRVEIEWFAGPHSINADGTYDFLHRHLDWPTPEDD